MGLLKEKLRGKVETLSSSTDELREQVAADAKAARDFEAKRRAGQANSADYEAGIEAARRWSRGKAELARRSAGTVSARAYRPQSRAILDTIRRREAWAFEPTTSLDSTRLSDYDVKELARLLKLGDRNELSKAERRRFEKVIERAADSPGMFDRKRREKEGLAKAKADGARLAREMLPRRPAAEPGSIALPAYLFDWLRDPRLGVFEIGDLGVLAALLYSFANCDAKLFAKATFDRPDGSPMITLRDAGHSVRLAPAADTSGTKLRASLLVLERNKWVGLDRAGGLLRVRPGERMRKLLGPEIAQ